MTRIFTFQEAAEFLRITPRTLTNWLKAGAVPGRKVQGTWLFREDELLEALSGKLNQNQTGSPALVDA